MFSKSLAKARERVKSDCHSSRDVELLPLDCLPESYTLQQLCSNAQDEASGNNIRDELEWLLIFASSLEHPERLVREQLDSQYTRNLLTTVSRQMLPNGDIVTLDEAPEDDKSSERSAAIRATKYKAEVCFRIINSLYFLSKESAPVLDQNVLLSILAFTDLRDPWMTGVSNEIALQILQQSKDLVLIPEFIIEFVLKSFLRPLFLKSKPSTITATGRKAMPSSAPPKRYEAASVDRSNKPWKYDKPYAVTILRWVVQNSSAEVTQQSWNQYIPPLLTLLDEGNSEIRARGLEIVVDFIPKFSTKLLDQTGLGDVIVDAIMPTLLFLPNLTPVDESIRLQKPAYEALYILADIQYPQGSDNIPDGKVKLYFRILRHGVLQAYAHSYEYPRIVEILLQQVQILVDRLKLNAVKQLKDLMPIFSSVLSDPFGTSTPSVLLAGIKSLQITILNCWPRMSETSHRIEAIKAITLCWGAVITDERESSIIPEAKQRNKEIGNIKEGLKSCGRILVKAVEGRFDIEAELQPLLRADPSLVDVFGVNIRDSKSE
ncbi:hypothetical protein F5884DRAFT_793275 [Xylogone sp. PMI_703]|nr:hypothetical protein F5884DRAFT_793275 [Xylogone sp. PMI_703]